MLKVRHLFIAPSKCNNSTVLTATAHLCSDITDKQRRLAEITEMIHTASLVHDDVVDDCDTRRGESSFPSPTSTQPANCSSVVNTLTLRCVL